MQTPKENMSDPLPNDIDDIDTDEEETEERLRFKAEERQRWLSAPKYNIYEYPDGNDESDQDIPEHHVNTDVLDEIDSQRREEDFSDKEKRYNELMKSLLMSCRVESDKIVNKKT